MKGYYIFSCENGKSMSLGVSRKINRQISVLEKHAGIELVPLKYDMSVIDQVLFRLPYISRKGNYTDVLGKINDPDFIYIRRDNYDKDYYEFLKSIRKKWPGCKIIMELFTYPYDKDDFFRSAGKMLTRFPLYLKDRHYRGKVKGLIDRFVVYSEDEEVFGIRTIRTINGYDVSSVAPREPKIEKRDEQSSINLVAVAYLQPQHGYERVIKGLADFYRLGDHSREVFLHIVGDGPEKKRYKKLVKRYGLEKYILFYGEKRGEELRDIYNCCDLGLCSFGMYKYGLSSSSSLKIPEYLAYGLPIITGCKISMLGNEKLEYCLEFPNDKSSIDIKRIITFHDLVYSYSNQKELTMIIRDYAMKHFSENLSFAPIIEYLKEK